MKTKQLNWLKWESIIMALAHRPISDIQFFYDLFIQGRQDEIYQIINDELEDQRFRWSEECDATLQ